MARFGRGYIRPIPVRVRAGAYRAGVKIWLDPAVRVTHHKTLPIGWPSG